MRPRRGQKRKSKKTPQRKSQSRSTSRSTPTPRSRPTRTAKSKSKARPVTISLDVTFSSESSISDHDSDVEIVLSPTPKKRKTSKNAKPNKDKATKASVKSTNSTKITSTLTKKAPEKFPETETPESSSLGNEIHRIMNSDSDSDEDIAFIPTERKSKLTQENGSVDISSDEENLYTVNYQEDRLKALQNVQKRLESINAMVSDNTSLVAIDSTIDSTTDSPICTLSTHKDEPDPQRRSQRNRRSSKRGNSKADEVDLSLDKIDGSWRNPKRNAKTKKALASLEAFAKRFEMKDIQTCDNSLTEVVDDIIMTEKDTDTPITLRWGTEYIRHTIKKGSSFAELYQEIAEKHKVSVSQVVLSFKDSIISPDALPSDCGITIGDIIEAGICNVGSSDEAKGETTSTHLDDNSLELKVQTSNRKVVHTLRINKYDKFSILMQNYANLRNLPSHKLKFKFDGDILQPSDTPFSLDLEGGECIDAFEI